MACLFQYQLVGIVMYSPQEYARCQPQGPGSQEQLNSSCDNGTNPKIVYEQCHQELFQHMVSKPCQPTSASPSRPSLHYLDMHISCLEGMSETHVGQSSHLASL